MAERNSVLVRDQTKNSSGQGLGNVEEGLCVRRLISGFFALFIMKVADSLMVPYGVQ